MLGTAWPRNAHRPIQAQTEIYDEIATAEKWPNYRIIPLLGFCLHVMGLKVHEGSNFGRKYRALHKAVLAWTKRSFIALQRRSPQVFEGCLRGNISYDEENARLVRTYELNGFRGTPEYVYFDLSRPPG